ncbi:MAG: TraR/DksA family transcriptional regulator [Bryobacteraceae bacterium]
MNVIEITRPHANRKAALERRLTDLAMSGGRMEELKIETLADAADQMRSSADRELAIERADRDWHSIREIRVALAKMAEGVYGVCETCEEHIAPRRLDAVPWARLCVRCQQHEEGGPPPLPMAA